MDWVWAALIVLILLLALEAMGSIGRGLINLLLITALVIMVYRLSQGRNIATGK
ncbi:MAG: hypothetical protein Q7S92_06595 [Candidatus Diapherotrites archaeon]|nr:hypothetical protein [Candidatus Diapherotrites archaeon]